MICIIRMMQQLIFYNWETNKKIACMIKTKTEILKIIKTQQFYKYNKNWNMFYSRQRKEKRRFRLTRITHKTIIINFYSNDFIY